MSTLRRLKARLSPFFPLLFAVWALGGCSETKDKSKTISPLPTWDRDTPTGWECKVDTDCAVSFRIPGQCCSSICGKMQAYHKGELAELEAEHKEHCAKGWVFKCPHVSCGERRPEPVASCEAGVCVSTQVP